MTRLYLGKFGDAGAASFVGLGIEPGGEDLFCHIVGDCAVGKAVLAARRAKILQTVSCGPG